MSLLLSLALATALSQGTIEGEPVFRDPPACWDGSQHELNVCASKDYQQADVAMNAQWAKTAALMRRVDKDQGRPNETLGNSSHFTALLNGQRAWLRYRDAYCPIFGADGGSMAPMLRNVCLRDVTKARTEQLKSLIQNPATGNPYYQDQ